MMSASYCTPPYCPTGSLSLTGKNGQIFGEMNIDTDFYQIPYLGDGINALVKIRTQNTTPVCISDDSYTPPIDTGITDRNLCPVVTILILYTQAVKDAHADIENIAMQSYNDTKQALINSKVTTSEIDLQLAGIALLPDFTATGAWPADTFPIVKPSSDARKLRDLYKADLVMIMVPNIYPQFIGAVFQFGGLPTTSGNKSRNGAFAFVAADRANAPDYTFVHEFGHLFGARHQRGVEDEEGHCWSNHDDGGAATAHAYCFTRNCTFIFQWCHRAYKTVVSACQDEDGRKSILYFSNLDVEYDSHAIGTTDHCNNAQVLRDASCAVSSYEVSHDVNVTIVAPAEVCPGSGFTVYGGVNGDFGPYIYTWQYQIGSGGAWITVPGHPQSISIDAPSGFYGVIYVQLTGSNGFDQSTATTGTVSNWLCDHHRQVAPSSMKLSDGQFIKVFPNPTTGFLNILLKEPIEREAIVGITNLLGMSYFSATVPLGNTPVDQFHLDLPSLPNGQYLLTVQSPSNAPRTVKFTFIK